MIADVGAVQRINPLKWTHEDLSVAAAAGAVFGIVTGYLDGSGWFNMPIMLCALWAE